MSVALGYGILTVAAIGLILGAVFVLAVPQRASHERVHGADPLRRYAPCVLWVTSPRTIICSGGRGYVWQGGDWLYIGKATPVPVMPR